MRVIDKNYSSIAVCSVLLYLIAIAAYSVVPERIEISEQTQKVFYWVNNTILMFTIPFIFSKFVVEVKPKILYAGTAYFLLVVGIFQILVCFGYSFGILWALFCPCYILFLLITMKYVGNKLQK